ncbi:hypothetical protein [Noviherbaspirillum sedimenti]|uniref:Transmembrane protein n=1 Tax=Noviherbaspirillum sedimenti TaxID=2320865 RepID=A0A3A3GTD4_9BURK|nr:hypothetical protein [Noviherbaspirillum sedimenti]RJG04260.1 hypothetical protein D3878_06280 [Noviherbaspirillum sedimenti]
MLLIVAIAWIYVVLMMSITEHSVVAGIMTFLLYCVLPLTIILYLMATPQRRRRRQPETAPAQAGATADLPAAAPATATTETPEQPPAR